MRFIRPLAPLVVFLSGLLASTLAFAHAADEEYNLTVTADLIDDAADRRMEETLYIPMWFLMDEVFSEGVLLRDLAGKEAEVKAQIGGWMAHHNPVLADGEEVRPQIRSMEARSANWLENQPFPAFAKDLQKEEDAFTRRSAGIKLVMAYPLKAAPRTLSLRWRRFITKTTPEGGLSQPPVTVAFFHDGKHRIQDLTPQEPEWVWHSDAVAQAPASAKLSQKWEASKWRIPAVPLALALGGAVVALLLWRRNKAVAGLILATDLALGAFLGFSGIGFVTTDSPFQKQLARPDPAQARVVFDGLLRGVYKAFDYNKDAQIYDALAQCVDGPILEQIYRDVHGALVLDDSDGGGAICQVDEVKVTKADLLPAPAGEPGALALDCAWSVRGKVSHWGHTHTRANAYAAKITLAPRAGQDGPQWKITACAVTEQTPVDVK